MVIGEGVDDLLSGPLGIGVFSHIKVNDLPAVMPKDEEDIEDTEGGGGNGEEVAGSDVGDVIGQEGSPSLRRRLPDTNHVLGHGPFGDVVAQQQEFGEDSWAPQSGFSRDIRRISSRISAWMGGRPGFPALDFHRQ